MNVPHHLIYYYDPLRAKMNVPLQPHHGPANKQSDRMWLPQVLVIRLIAHILLVAREKPVKTTVSVFTVMVKTNENDSVECIGQNNTIVLVTRTTKRDGLDGGAISLFGYTECKINNDTMEKNEITNEWWCTPLHQQQQHHHHL